MTKHAKERNIPIAALREHFDYNPETGIITWRKPAARRCRAGEVAGIINDSGYVLLTLLSIKVRGHRVAWAMHHGEWPDGEIDHINNNRADNRIANLRLATRRQNSVNQPGRGSNTGVKGVYWYKNRYMALARDQTGRQIYLGRHKTLDDAKAAYDEFVIKTRGEFARTD